MNTMNRISIIVLMLLVVTLTASGQTVAEKDNPFLTVLKAGQPVSFKEVSGRYLISTFDGLPGVQSHKVIEIANDHIVVQDISGISEIHIPVCSIMSVVRMKLPRD